LALSSRSTAYVPVAELSLAWVQVAVRVNEALLKERAEALALFFSETRTTVLAFWIVDVNLMVCNVQVTTPDDRLAKLAKIVFKESLEILVPLLHPVVESSEIDHP
jgi:hypothetical protein